LLSADEVHASPACYRARALMYAEAIRARAPAADPHPPKG
jgi:hypothetical protein